MTSTKTQNLTTTQTAEILQVSTRTVHRWVEYGELTPSMRTVGGHYRFHPAVVNHLLRQLEATR
ncbi:MAG: helix-turn-helix domain-containing protein [Fuerstiella sp.]